MEFTGSGINWLDKKVLSNSNTIVHDSNYEDYPYARLKAPDYDNEKRTDEDVTDLARKIYNPIGVDVAQKEDLQKGATQRLFL